MRRGAAGHAGHVRDGRGSAARGYNALLDRNSAMRKQLEERLPEFEEAAFRTLVAPNLWEFRSDGSGARPVFTAYAPVIGFFHRVFTIYIF